MIEKVIQHLSEQNYLDDLTYVSNSLREEYARTYAKLSGGCFDSLTNSNKKYALKLAGLNLQKVVNSKYSGFIYCITNPAYTGYVKIGITNNVKKRLASYQTYDPYRSFRLECYRFVYDKRLAEKTLLQVYKTTLDKGEWVSDTNVIDYIKSLY